MFIFHIDLTLKVAMVTKMATNIGLNRENVIFDHNLEVLLTMFLKIRYQHSLIPKDISIFYVACYHLSSI